VTDCRFGQSKTQPVNACGSNSPLNCAVIVTRAFVFGMRVV
jgi:hypothetical protein